MQRRTRPGARCDGSSRQSPAPKREKPVHRQKLECGLLHICAIRAILQPQMSSIAALEKRVKALEDDEDFKASYVPATSCGEQRGREQRGGRRVTQGEREAAGSASEGALPHQALDSSNRGEVLMRHSLCFACGRRRAEFV